MSTQDESNSTEIYAGNIIEAGAVQSLLESNDIQAYLRDEIMGTLNPWVVSAGGVGAVKVIISSLDAARAKTIVEEYQKNIKDK